MPTNQNAYNTRLTDEALEKRFRDTFRSQGGAELVDDLYASGVIIPVVDFTQSATGDVLATNLQTAWDFTTGSAQVASTTPVTLISTSGFWRVDLNYSAFLSGSGTGRTEATIDIYDGTTYKAVWAFANVTNFTNEASNVVQDDFIVFLRAGDSLTAVTQSTNYPMDIWYRQIATVNGDLVKPFGFTSS